jgi:crooked neck
MFALHLLRRDQLPRARKVLGLGLGKAPRPKLFRGYIELEEQLCNMDRVRILYQKYI